ncbi:hypothetical protein ALP16_05117 [Pseudomonas savastanoi]|uniref:Uncharacterized protein n=1 Tax=Pseudomonas savastanoi TaxID=29438 RepID=A0A3M5ZSR9_PSESS|nr:Uncharacterized protein ALO74_04664 [Pseudomonas syringae pv. cunninghamiae]KUG42467.1 Uncharacterized protein ALP79_04549 [Pseudomonas savastanoi pv. fraxini]RML76552.1 hypothetical protein ALQ90_05531 [Pseudomonas savastanoi pv. savastanoi]RMV10127.1 hypothetical protein ALP16_05117 [Pseudomonas savastanoi]RMR67116.1 hypothetical protein ALP82_04917 [Pseudomonas savastanoi pv. fraxini]
MQRPAAGALDLEFGVVTHAGQQLLALPASVVFQHLHWSPCASPNKKPRLGGVWEIAIYRLALFKSPYPAAALRRKSHIVVPFYLPPERLERGSFGVGRVWPEFNMSSTTAAPLTWINGTCIGLQSKTCGLALIATISSRWLGLCATQLMVFATSVGF